MARNRIAIAHFASRAAALHMQATLAAEGGQDMSLTAAGDEERTETLSRLEVPLPAHLERRLLAILLASDARLVDVHDAES